MLNNNFSTKLMITKRHPSIMKKCWTMNRLNIPPIAHVDHREDNTVHLQQKFATMKGETHAKEPKGVSHNQHYVKYTVVFINIMMHSAQWIYLAANHPKF